MIHDPGLEAMMKRHEGVRYRPYQDTLGVWTVGWGHNLANRISEKAAHQIFLDDYTIAWNGCMTFPWFMELSQLRQWVVADMIFNLGLTRFRTFLKTIAFLEKKEYEQASAEMLRSEWAGQVGDRAIELSYMMRTDTMRGA